MPREISDRAGSAVRFEQWRRTPYAGKGPLPATRVEDPALSTHTLYYRAGLPATAGKLPVLLWANGGCRNTSIEFTAFLGELASHGYFIVANGRNDVPFATADLNTNPRANGQPPVQVLGEPPVQVLGGATVLAGLDWISKENRPPRKRVLRQARSHEDRGTRAILRWRPGVGSIEGLAHQSRCGAEQ